MIASTQPLSRIAALALVSLLLVPVGAASATVSPVGHAAPDADAGSTNASDGVQFARTVEEMQGHLAVSAHFVEAGNRDIAVVHAGHPTAEYWSVVGPEIRDANASLAARVNETLREMPSKARSLSPSAYRAHVEQDVDPLLERATRAVVDEDVSTPSFRGRVSAALLRRATQEYAEGVNESGAVVENTEYWDAQGFRMRAAALYDAGVRPSLDDHAAEELDELFESLETAMGDSKPPADVERLVSAISGEYAEYLGVDVGASESDAARTVDEIEEHLEEAVEAYEAGDVDRAQSIVHQTYLSYFEGLEGRLIEKDPDLVHDLEADFNEDLPGLMERNASVSEVREEVEQMESKLARAEQLLDDSGSTTISLGDETTGSETTAPPETTSGATQTTSAGAPGFTALAALLAVVGALLALRARTGD